MRPMARWRGGRGAGPAAGSAAARRRPVARQSRGRALHARDRAPDPERAAQRHRVRGRTAEARRDRGGMRNKAGRKKTVPLVELAHARSGDKGDTANVGLIALKPEYYPILVQHVTAARVARHFQGMISGPVERFELPS